MNYANIAFNTLVTIEFDYSYHYKLNGGVPVGTFERLKKKLNKIIVIIFINIRFKLQLAFEYF